MIYLCRHGETELNLARRYQGHTDSPLTALGESQARRMGERLAGLIDDPTAWTIVSSPLGRAHATAGIIQDVLGGAGAVTLDARLAEASMGEWDGLHLDDLAARRPEHLPYPERFFQGPGGETLDVLSARVGAWLASVPEDAKLIAVSHGVTGRIVRGLYAGLSRVDLLAQEAPQSAIFRLHGGGVDRIDCDPV